MTVLAKSGTFQLTQMELDGGTVLIKSDVYPVKGERNSFTWVAVHPSGWEAHGDGTSHQDCIRQVNALLAEEVEALGHTPPGRAATIRRTWVGPSPEEEKLVGFSVDIDTLP